MYLHFQKELFLRALRRCRPYLKQKRGSRRMIQSPIFILLLILNLFAFVLIGIDKNKSIGGRPRIPEVHFFFLAILFSSLGILLGMFFFHHKTRKWYFPVGVSIILIQQAALVYLITERYFSRF